MNRLIQVKPFQEDVHDFDEAELGVVKIERRKESNEFIMN